MKSGKELKNNGGRKKMSDFSKLLLETPVPVSDSVNHSTMLVTLKKLKAGNMYRTKKSSPPPKKKSQFST